VIISLVGVSVLSFLQCLDTVGWMTGRASGSKEAKKTSDISWGHMQIICASFQADNHDRISSLDFFYSLDALPDAQPTVSKH